MTVLDARQMTIVVDGNEHSSTVTEVVKLPVKPDNMQLMLDYVQKWHETTIAGLPGFQSAAILESSAEAVFVYAHWSSKAAIENANHDPRMTAYFQGLFPLLSDRPEIHFCSVGMVAVAEQTRELVEMHAF